MAGAEADLWGVRKSGTNLRKGLGFEAGEELVGEQTRLSLANWR